MLYAPDSFIYDRTEDAPNIYLERLIISIFPFSIDTASAISAQSTIYEVVVPQ